MDWSVADIALIAAVTTMGVAVAYLHNPEHKATVLMLPEPFSLATLAVWPADRRHRTPLPAWIKTPAIAVVVTGLVEIKHLLGGFTTMFPMVGVVASYESRHSLWRIVRRIGWLLMLMPPMMATIRLLQPYVRTPAAVLLSWPVILTGLWVWHTRFRETGPSG